MTLPTRFPAGSIRAAVAQWGDDWALEFDCCEHPPAYAEVIDDLAMGFSAARRVLMPRDIGYHAPLPANLRRGL